MLRSSVIFSAFFALSLASHPSFDVQFQWNYANYTWPSCEAYSTAKNNGSYIENNNIILGIKVWKDKMYLSLPRHKKGVPVTLAVISSTVQNGTMSPLLEPYPNWEMQKIGECSAWQNVRDMEIDPKGRMWVLDVSKLGAGCPAKLVIIDLENDGKVLRSKDFFDDKISLFSYIVVDHEHGGMAYISSQVLDSIIVYSLANNTMWYVHHSSMSHKSVAVEFFVGGVRFNEPVNIHAIALSPASIQNSSRVLYYSPLSSFELFSVPTQALIDAQHKSDKDREEEIDKYVNVSGYTGSQMDSMVMSSNGSLYFGLLNADSIGLWKTKVNSTFDGTVVAKDHDLMQWPRSLSFDDKGQMWFISTPIHLDYKDLIDINSVNCRVFMSKVNMRNYQYYEDGSVPDWPVV